MRKSPIVIAHRWLSSLQRTTRRAWFSQQTKEQQDQQEVQFRDMIQRPRETLGIEKENFEIARSLCEFVTGSRALGAFVLALPNLLGADTKLSPFLLCDMQFRTSDFNIALFLETLPTKLSAETYENEEFCRNYPAILPWGLIRPVTVDTWVGTFSLPHLRPRNTLHYTYMHIHSISTN